MTYDERQELVMPLTQFYILDGLPRSIIYLLRVRIKSLKVYTELSVELWLIKTCLYIIPQKY